MATGSSKLWNGVLRFYSAWFRFGGLLLAVMSLVASLAIGFETLRDGFVLVDGTRDRSISSLATAICMPLTGVVIGLGLYFFVPKVNRSSSDESRP